MRYGGEADVDGSCQPWTEVVDRGRKLYSVDGSSITPLHLVKVKRNFDEA